MTNKLIREQQKKNAYNLKQVNFPKPMVPNSIKYKCDREMARRKAQIAKGQLKAENGLAK